MCESSGTASESPEEQRQRNKLKKLSIAMLVAQNSFITLLAKTTRVAAPGRVMYVGSAAVFASELVKMPVCLIALARSEGSVGGMVREVKEKVFVRWKDTLLMGIPALCYCFQNYLFFVALSNLSATSYQLWSQSKTLTTALFFVLYIGGVLRPIQWAALALLSAGVGLVQYSDSAAAAAIVGMNPLVGVGAVLASSFLSGFANVYLEKMMKKSDASLWIRNVQLGLFSIPQTAVLMLTDLPKIQLHGLFGGFTPAVWMVVLLKALGGLIVAAVIKYADNILKTYATAIAIVLTCLLSIPLYGSIPSMAFLQGMALVIASMLLYNTKPKAVEESPAA